MISLKNKNRFTAILLVFASALTFWTCLKTEFDEPPVGDIKVDITPNITIKALKALHISQDGYDKVTDTLIIAGEIIMDDRSGNYYKTLVIQDATGGIEVKFNDGFLYNSMPVGRTIYIRCKDLILTDYNGLPQLTGSLVVENGVPRAIGLTEGQVRQKIIKGNYATTPLAPKLITPGDLPNVDLVNTLVKLDNVQFVQCDAGKTYADALTQSSLNRTLEDCNGQELLLRTSGFADFAASKTPTGKGTVTGVMGIYGTDYQLYIRDLNDVSMNGDRCGTGAGPGTAVLKDIAYIRSLYTGTTTAAPANVKIKGTVTSDRNTNNLNGQNVFIQDGTAGIVVRFLDNHCFEVGDVIEVNISGQELSNFHQLVQVNKVPLKNANILASGLPVTPRTATVAEVNANFDAWESTLVRISGVTVTGGGVNYAYSHTVTDATGNIPLFTQSYAAFALQPIPTGTVTLTAIISDYDGKQLILRGLGDVQ